MTTIDWGAALESAESEGGGSFELLPKADYNMVVDDAEIKISQNGKTMYVIRASITDGPHKNRKMWNNFVFSPDSSVALSIFFRHMAALGLTQDFFRQAPEDDAVIAALKGREFRGKVGTRTWQGVERNELTAFYPAATVAGSSTAPPPPPAQGAPAPAAPPPPPPPPPPPAPAAATPAPSSEVPF